MEQLASKSIKEVLSEPEGQRLAQVTEKCLCCAYCAVACAEIFISLSAGLNSLSGRVSPVVPQRHIYVVRTFQTSIFALKAADATIAVEARIAEPRVRIKGRHSLLCRCPGSTKRVPAHPRDFRRAGWHRLRHLLPWLD